MLLKGMEGLLLLLLLLAVPARHVSAVLACDKRTSDYQLTDTSTCRKEDINDVLPGKGA